MLKSIITSMAVKNSNRLSSHAGLLIVPFVAAMLTSSITASVSFADSPPGTVSLSSLSFVDKDLAAARKEIADLKKELETVKEGRASLEKLTTMSLSVSSREAAAAKEAVKEAKQESDRLRGRLSELSSTKASTNNELLASLKKKQEDLEADYKKLTVQTVTLKNETNALKTENASLKTKSAAAEAEVETLRKKVAVCSTEQNRLSKVISAKNEALDNAIKALSGKSPKPVTASTAGEEYQEEVLGKVIVNKKGDQVIVTVSAEAERLADARFMGAVLDKKKTVNGITYTLEASKLK